MLFLTIFFISLLSLINGSIVDHDWDFILFTQQWPLTSCIDHMAKNDNASCNLYLNMTSWGVHGLWPTKAGSRGPNFCNSSWHFDVNQIKTIEPYLLKYWPNIFGEESVSSLWKHEWTKHGTCAAELADLNSEMKYFQKGIDLAIQYDLVSILGNEKIFPSDENPYELKLIMGAVQKAIQKTPIIDCTYEKDKKRHELSQIKICLDRKFRVVDCDQLKLSPSKNAFERPFVFYEVENHGNCPDTDIYYPSSVRTANLTYRYPLKMAVQHTRSWFKKNSRCSSWVCDWLDAIHGLSLFSF